MSAVAQQAVLAASISPAAVKLVALVLAWHANTETGHAWPSVETLARECDMSKAHAKRAITALKRLGVLLVVAQSDGGGRRNTTVYAFDMARLAELANPVHRRTRFAGEPPADDTDVCPENRDTAPRGGSSASREGVHRRASRGSPANPKRDEREPKAPLSSETPSPANSAGGRSAEPGATVIDSGKVVPMPRSQQPALSEEERHKRRAALLARKPEQWANDDAELSRMGFQLGLGTLEAAALQHVSRAEYCVRAIRAWADLKAQHRAAEKTLLRTQKHGQPQAQEREALR